MAIYSEYYVTGTSERLVNKIWCLDNFSSSEPPLRNQLLPNGYFNVGIVIGKGLQVHFRSKTYKITEGVYLCSQVTEKTVVDIEPFTKIIFIQLHAWSFFLFPQYNLSNFLNSIVEFEQDSILPQHQKYFSCKEPKNIVRKINHICKELQKKNQGKTLVENICGRIQAGDTSVSTVLENSGWSLRSTQMIQEIDRINN